MLVECKICREQILVDSLTCPNCGDPSPFKINEDGKETITEPAVRTSRPEKSPHGIGGWLMLLVLGMMIFGPIMGAGSINAGILSVEKQYPQILAITVWSNYKTASWLVYLFFAVASFYGGWGLAKERELSAVRRAKIILWITGPLATIFMGVVVPSVIFGSGKFVNSEIVGQLVGSIIAAGIWTTYLAKSKRVRNTYACNVSN